MDALRWAKSLLETFAMNLKWILKLRAAMPNSS